MPAALATVTTAGATPADATPVVDELAAGTITMIALPHAGNWQPLAIAAIVVEEEAEGVGKEEEEPTARRPIARQATSAPGTAAASPSETIYPGATAAPPSTAIRKVGMGTGDEILTGCHLLGILTDINPLHLIPHPQLTLAAPALGRFFPTGATAPNHPT